ncbi:MAG: hypothetical protein JXB49_23490 [Bacteroidales bacterium]|nr:hypothetical protein [Bacteroidales bacterium]
MNSTNMVLILITFIVLFGFTNCEKTHKCEKENYGTVSVTNETGRLLMVDCRYSQFPDVSEGEFILQNGQSVSWNMKPSVQLILSAAVYYETGSQLTGPEFTTFYILNQCETYALSWILYKDDIILPRD